MDAQYFIRVIIEGRDNLSRALASSMAGVRAWRREVQGMQTDLDKVTRAHDASAVGVIRNRNATAKALNDTRLFRKETDNTHTALLRLRSELDRDERSMTGWGRAVLVAGNAARGAARSMFDLQRGVRDVDFQTRRSQGTLFNFAYNITRGLSNAIESFTRMNTVAALLAPILFTVVTAVLNLAAALVAVASAAALAAAALGGALLSAVVQLVPVVGLLAAAFHRLGLVMKASSLAAKDSGDASIDAASAAKQHREAVERLADAQYTLKQAYISVAEEALDLKEAEEALALSRKQAGRDLVDARFAKEEAILAEKDATLSLLEAQKALREEEQRDRKSEFEIQSLQNYISQVKQELEISQQRGDQAGIINASAQLAEAQQQLGALRSVPGADNLDIRRRRLDVAQARLGQRESRVDRARAIDDANLAERRGINLAPAVVQAERNKTNAIRAHVAALHALAKARREVRDTRTDLAQPTTAAPGSTKTPLEEILEDLSPAEKRLLQTVEGFKKLWASAVRPLTDLIVDAVNDAIVEIEKLLRDKRFMGAFRNLAQEIADQIRVLSRFFTSQEQRDFFTKFANLAADNLPRIVTLFMQLIRLAERIALAFAPVFEGILKGSNRWLGRQIGRADQPANAPEGFEQNRLGAFAARSQGFLKDVAAFIGSFFRLMGAIVSVAAGPGGKALEDLTDVFNRWATNLKGEGRKGATEFFNRAIEGSALILKLLGQLIDLFFKLSASEGFESFLKVMSDVGVPALENIGKVYGAMFTAIAKAAENPFIGKLIELFATVYGISKLTPLGEIANAIAKTGIVIAITANTKALWANTASRGGVLPGGGRGGGGRAGRFGALGALGAGSVAAASVIILTQTPGASGLNQNREAREMIDKAKDAKKFPELVAALQLYSAWRAAGLPTGKELDVWLASVNADREKLGKALDAVKTGGGQTAEGFDLGKADAALKGGTKKTGRETVMGLVEGIEKALKAVQGLIANLLKKYLIQPMSAALKTQSPSKVTMKIGEDVADGLWKGITDRLKSFDVARVMRESITIPMFAWVLPATQDESGAFWQIGRRIGQAVQKGIGSIQGTIFRSLSGLASAMKTVVAAMNLRWESIGEIIGKGVVLGAARAIEQALNTLLKAASRTPRTPPRGGQVLPPASGQVDTGGVLDGRFSSWGSYPPSAWVGAPPFATGGSVGGLGSAIPIIAHVGEWVLNMAQQRRLATAVGQPLGKIRDWLFGPDPKPPKGASEQYADRPAVQAARRAARLMKKAGPGYFGPNVEDWGAIGTANAGDLGFYIEHPGVIDSKTGFEPGAPIFMDSPLHQMIAIGRATLNRIREGRGFWLPEGVRREAGFSRANKMQRQDWKRMNVIRGLQEAGVSGRDESNRSRRGPGLVDKILTSPLWNYARGGVIGSVGAGWSPPMVSAPSFAAGGIVKSSAAGAPRTESAKSITQQFSIETASPTVDVEYVMRVAKIHAESSF